MILTHLCISNSPYRKQKEVRNYDVNHPKSSYIMMPCLSLTWYFSPVIIQFISIISPKISMTEFRLTNFCTIFQKFLSLSSVIVQLICVLRLVLFSGYFLSLHFFLINYVITRLSTVINYFLVKAVI